MFIVAPATSAPGDLDGDRLAGQHRLIDCRLALDDDAVGSDLLARTDDEQVADTKLGDRDEHFLTVAQHPRLLGAELEQRADRRARARRARASKKRPSRISVVITAATSKYVSARCRR